MRVWFAALALIVLTGCSDTPTVENKAKGTRAAVRADYGTSGISADVSVGADLGRGLRADPHPQPESGESEIAKTARPGRGRSTTCHRRGGRQRSYTWSAIEVRGATCTKESSATQEEAWGGAQGQERPFLAAAIKIDTPEALETAIGKSAEYLNKPGEKPRVNFMLEADAAIIRIRRGGCFGARACRQRSGRCLWTRVRGRT